MFLNRLLSIIGIAFSLFIAIPAFSQEDPALFHVDNEVVPVSEFAYIYAKTNGPKADFSLASLSEYLELYKKFKLKVHRAREMKLDTLASFQQELAGYRKQLANNYLIDKEVTHQLIDEAYQRIQKDVRFNHILVKVDLSAAPEDTLKAWKKIQEAHKALSTKPFGEVAKTYSEDESTTENGGDLGFFTAVFPNGFYALETVVYNTPVKSISQPVRTKLGYHIIQVTDIRAARGEMEAAHILIRKSPREEGDIARVRIDSIYRALQAGGDFAKLAKELSDDKLSASKGGNIGVFGINRYERNFEDAAFALKTDGDYSSPVETSSGWHIILRIKGSAIDPYELAKRRLEPKLKKDDRYELARVSMVEKIRTEIGVQENNAVFVKYAQTQNDTFFTFLWRPESSSISQEIILTLAGKKKIPLREFEDFLQKNAGKRVNLKRTHDVINGLRTMLDAFIQEECVRFEEDRLEMKYPEFKSLMREYEEGILLFEATKRVVWDRASQDSIGLDKFFKEEVSQKYKWGERARVTYYQVETTDQKLLEEIRKSASSKDAQSVMKKFNKGEKPLITTREILYEHGKNTAVDQMAWKEGTLSYSEEDKRNNGWNFLKIEEVLPPTAKTLDEARGYVIADYQDKLEQEWIKELSATYKIKVNQSAFQKLVKKS